MKFGALLTMLQLKNHVHETRVLYTYVKENTALVTTVFSAKLVDPEHWGVYAQVLYSVTRAEHVNDHGDLKRARLIRADLLFPPYISATDQRPTMFVPDAKLRQLENHLL